MEINVGQSQEESKKYIKWLVLIVLLLIFLAVIVFILKNKSNNPSPTNNFVNQPKETVSEEDHSLEGQETRELRVNFNDRQVVFNGYPYVNTKYQPRLYNLIYVNTIYNYDDMVSLTDPSIKTDDSYEYELSSKELKIYIPLSRTADDKPIWQTMEIVQRADLVSLLPDCSASSYQLDGNLNAQNFICTKNNKNTLYFKNSPCFLSVDESTGILYKQYSSDETTSQNMCEIIKNNYFYSVAYEPYK